MQKVYKVRGFMTSARGKVLNNLVLMRRKEMILEDDLLRKAGGREVVCRERELW